MNGTLLSSTVGFGVVEELLPRLRYGIDLYDQSASLVLRYGIDQVFTFTYYIHVFSFNDYPPRKDFPPFSTRKANGLVWMNAVSEAVITN